MASSKKLTMIVPQIRFSVSQILALSLRPTSRHHLLHQHHQLNSWIRSTLPTASWHKQYHVYRWGSSIGRSHQIKHSSPFRRSTLGSDGVLQRSVKVCGPLGCYMAVSLHNEQLGKEKRRARYVRDFSLSAKAIVDASPAGIQPYLQLSRVDQPIGTWLVYLPSTWSISLAAAPGAPPDFFMLGLFGLGALLMRGAGCTVNDMIDKDIDKQVARTKNRPLANGQLTDFQALSFLGLQLSAALLILLSFDLNSIMLGASSVILMVTYPLMKRITFWPQIFLGLTLNWGVLLGWSVVHGACDWSVCLPLYTAGVLHTVIYDTIYAHRDKDDDIKAGVLSTALYMGDSTKMWLGSFTAGIAGCLTLSGLLVDQTWPYYTGIALVTTHLARQLLTLDLSNPDDCAKKFRSNRHIGMILFAAIVAGNFLREKEKKPETEDEQILESGQEKMNHKMVHQ